LNNPVFIDTDTASDDAVALMMAFSHWGDDVVALGVVAGNCSLEQATINALYTRELCGASMPVYAGAGKPLIRSLRTAEHAHGNDGMSDIGLVPTSLADSVPQPAAGYAPDILIDLADRYGDELTLVTLGPLTNIAVALTKRPDIANKIRHCTMMGGTSDNYGNITPVSEYNVWADPEAAEIVFSSALRITMVGWDISRRYGVITDELAARLRALARLIHKAEA
jgi:purine nucleosidase